MVGRKQKINPYIENIFGKWFKNIVTLSLIVAIVAVLVIGLIRNWIVLS